MPPLHYEDRGSGPALLLLPGALGSGRTDFGPQLEAFSDAFRVIAPDPRGYGQSRPPEREFPPDFLERDARDMADLMAGLGIERFYAAGWSDGATTAVLLALACPERVRKLVIWGGNSFFTAEDVERLEAVRSLDSWSSRMRASLEALYGEGLQDLWSRYCDAIGAITRAGGEICRARLHEIRCPTLILHGEQDPLVPSVHPQVFVEGIAGARLYRFPEGRHNIHLAFSREFNRVVRGFLGPVQVSAGTHRSR
jgi:valacyclovir hydrolase